MFLRWVRRAAVPPSKPAIKPRRFLLDLERLEDRLALSTLFPYVSRDLVYDGVRNQLDVVTNGGRVLQVNPQTLQIVNAVGTGANLNGADISPDGKYLYVTDAGSYGTSAYLRRIDLNTLAITNLSYTRAAGETGSWDVALANNGKGLFDSMSSAAGPVPLHQITLSTNQITTRTDDPGVYGGGRLPANTLIQRSADRSLFLFTQAGNTGGNIFTYKASTDTFTQGPNLGANLSNALSAVNRNGSLLAVEVPGGLLVVDAQFHQVNFLQGFDGGVAFDPTKDLMYAVNTSLGQIVTFSTTTWTAQSQMAIGESTTPGQAYGNGTMTVSNDGHWLFLATPSGVREYSLVGNTNPATHFALSGFNGSAVAGTPITVTISALDQYGNIASTYAGTVHFTSSDPQAVMPPDYTFTPADAGVHTFALTFKTAGYQSFAGFDIQYPSAFYVNPPVQVFAGALAAIGVSAPSPDPTGYAFVTTFSARDAYNNVIQNYAGTIHIASSDPAAVLPADYTFTASDHGLHSLPVTINTAGNQTIKATDNSNSAVAGTTTVLVGNYVPGLHFTASSFSPTVAVHTPFTYTVTALDSNNQVGVHYTGTIHFQSSDPTAVLPADYTFTDADHGVHTFSITLGTVASSAWVSFADTAYIGYSNGASVTENVVPAPASNFVVTGWPTAAVTAGSTGSITVTAKDSYGNVATNYTGTVHFTSTDSQAVLPADYTFVAGDQGVHTFAYTLKTAGTQTVPATDVNNANLGFSSPPITVNPAAMVGFRVVIQPGQQAIGYTVYPMVFASDAYNNFTTYTGTVHYTSSDPAAILPPDHTFTASDRGLQSFGMVFETPGTQTFTATDVANPALTGTDSVQIGDYIPGLHFSVSTPFWIYNAGQSFSATVTALDEYNHVATGYHGTVVFSSTDQAAGVVLPPNYTFTADAAGVHTFSGITLITRRNGANPAVIRATDPDNGLGGPGTGGTSLIIDVLAPSSFTVTGFPATTTAGSPATFTVTARDIYGNVSDWYKGTVHFTSSDPQAVLPADYTFTYSSSGASDQGVHTFTATLGTAGIQSISVNDVASPSVAGSETGITVTPAAASTFSLAGFPTPVLVGSSGSFTVTALDAYGNVATGYTGTVHFSSSDALASLPDDYTFTAGDLGVHSFSATVGTAGVQLTATDTAAPGVSGSQTVQVLNPVVAGSFIVTGFPATTTAGTTATFTVTVLDTAGNMDPGYTGTVHFASSDGQGVLPADYLFTAGDLGVHTFTASLRTAGVQALTVSDLLAPSVTGSQGDLTVLPAAAVGLRVDGFPSGGIAGVAAPLTVTALDAYGNVATGYTGTVHFTSNSWDIRLPADYTFTAADAGTHVFQVVLNLAWQQNITATDVGSPAIAGTASGLLVAPAAAYQISIWYPTTEQVGVPFTLIANIEDMYGNVIHDYTGTLHFASTDPAATLPADYTMTANDNGSYWFQVTFSTPGTQTLTVTDPAGILLGMNMQIAVS